MVWAYPKELFICQGAEFFNGVPQVLTCVEIFPWVRYLHHSLMNIANADHKRVVGIHVMAYPYVSLPVKA